MSRQAYYNLAKSLGYSGQIDWPRGSTSFWQTQARLLQTPQIPPTPTQSPPTPQTYESYYKPTLRELLAQINNLRPAYRPALQTYNITPTNPIYDDTDIKQLIKAHPGTIRVSYLVDGRLIREKIYNVPTSNFSAWWNKNYNAYDWRVDSEKFIFQDYFNFPNQKIVITSDLTLSPKKLEQFYADGETHCLLTPIHDWAHQKYLSSTNSTKRKYKSLLNKISKLTNTYKKGVPDNKLQEICNELNIHIEIEDLLRSTYKKFESNKKQKRLKSFKFINTRENHVELDEYTLDQKPIELPLTKLQEKQLELKSKKTFHLYSKSKLGTTWIQTLTDSYIYEGNKEIKNFNQTFQEFQMDYYKTKEVSDFIRTGVHVSTTVDFQDTSHLINTPVTEIDQEKSYTQFKSAPFYQGFPNITDFRKVPDPLPKDFLKTHIGYYKVEISNLPPILQKLSCYYNNITLPSPEILFLQSHGATVKPIYGAWGIPFHFDFTPDMYKKFDGTPNYSRWSGKTGSLNTTSQIYVSCTEKMANHIASIYPDCKAFKEIDSTDLELIVSKDKKKVYHLNHIFGFITSYSRIHTLTQLLQFPLEQIIRVNMDGIYLNNTPKNILPTFRLKSKLFPRNKAAFAFFYPQEHTIPPTQEYRAHHQYEIHYGSGGSGKTYYNMKKDPSINPYFTTIAWKLTREKIKEFNCDGSVLHRVLGIKCRPELIRNSTIVIDEASMIPDSMKNQIVKAFPYKKLIFCGDMDYQLPPVKGQKSDFSSFHKVYHTKNYRTSDPELLKILSYLRTCIKDNQKPDITKLPSCTKQYVIDNYKIEDFVLCSRRTCATCKKHTCNHKDRNHVDEWTKALKGEKWLITKSTADYSTGEIIIGSKPSGATLRHAFTVHSVQGMTCESNIYIDSRDLFDIRMLYTAVSRARRLDQIKVIQC